MTILDNAKQIAEAVHHLQNLELYQRVLALHSDIVGLVEQNIGLREEIAELRKQASLKEKMHFKAPFYYQDGDQTPYCPACWENNAKTIHVEFIHDNDRDTRWDCPTCKHMYLIRKRNYNQPRTPGYGGRGGPDSWME